MRRARVPRSWRWAAVLAWATFIWVLSDIPDLRSPFAQDFILRKIAHTLEFAILAGLLLWSLWPTAIANKKIGIIFIRKALVAASIAICYAVLDEIHQGFVLGRTASARDVVIDSLGVLFGLGASWLVLFFAKLRKDVAHN